MDVKKMMPRIEQMAEGFLNKETHLSHSSFSSFLTSPAHFLEYKFGERATSTDMDFGTLFDMFLLEPERFEQNYLEYSKENRPMPSNAMNKTENKEWLGALKESAKTQGKILVENTDVDYSRNMAAAIRRSQPAMALLNMCDETQCDLDFTWEGFRWKGRKDKSCSELTLDLKTTVSAKQRKFKQSIYTYGYHRQAFLYNIGDGQWNKPYFLLAIEKKPPFALAVHHVTEPLLRVAKHQILKGLEGFRECLISPEKFLLSYEFWAKKSHGVFEVSAY